MAKSAISMWHGPPREVVTCKVSLKDVFFKKIGHKG